VDSSYLPHAVNSEIFKPMSAEERTMLRQEKGLDKKFVCVWNNRNARRKQSGSLIYWFKEFLDKVGHDKACLIMHTDVKDQHGQDLEAIIHELGLVKGEILFSTLKIGAPDLAMMYNMGDLTINISDAEGFGLATLESLSCGTPILVNMTGGLQEQVTDGENWFGIGLEPASKAIIGSQQVPYIYEDRLNKDDFLNALTELYEMGHEKRSALGEAGRQYVQEKYNFENFAKEWDKTLTAILEKHGSWSTRSGYQKYEFKEIA
jgi:glycosyltransferase involved in cell wall biosynthesis